MSQLETETLFTQQPFSTALSLDFGVLEWDLNSQPVYTGMRMLPTESKALFERMVELGQLSFQ